MMMGMAGQGGAYLEWPITPNLRAEFDWRWLYMGRCTFGVDDLLGCFCRVLHGFFATYQSESYKLAKFRSSLVSVVDIFSQNRY